MGKGSGRRPKQISAEEEQRRWDAAFGKKEEPEIPAHATVVLKPGPGGRVCFDGVFEDENYYYKTMAGHFISRTPKGTTNPNEEG